MLFLRTPFYGVRLAVLLSVAVMLMCLDHKIHRVTPVRTALNAAVVPLQHMAKWPSDWVNWAAQSIASVERLKADNTRLRSQLLLVNAKLQRVISLEKENQDLRALLQSSQRVHTTLLTAQLLAVNPSPFVARISLNCGYKEGVAQGQAVLDATGVMGQVIHVGAHTSEVLLLTDNQSALPIQNARNGIRAIAEGIGNADVLLLQHVPKQSDFKVGDPIVTSGLGRRFPAGYPVGEVVAVMRDRGGLFATVKVRPAAKLTQSRQVLLVKTEAEAT